MGVPVELPDGADPTDERIVLTIKGCAFERPLEPRQQMAGLLHERPVLQQ